MITKSIIINGFEGWSGESVFELQNGEVWEQDGYKYQYFYAYRPMVMIEHNGPRVLMTVNVNSCSVKKLR